MKKKKTLFKKTGGDVKWPANTKMSNGGSADTFVKGFKDPIKDLYHGIKNYNFFEEKVPFADAYRDAPYGSTFSWNGKRYKKDLQKDKEVSRQSVLDKNPVFWDNMKKEIKANNENRYGKDGYVKYKSNELEKLNQKSLNDIIDLHIKSGNPDIKIGDANTVEFSGDAGRAFYESDNNTMTIYGWDKNKKVDTQSLISDYTQELLHARQVKDWGTSRFREHLREDYARHDIYYDSKKNKWINWDENYDSQMYDDPKSVEGVHYLQRYGLSQRLKRDFDIEEKDDAYNKNVRTWGVEDYITKDSSFHPYEDQGDLRKLQAVLDENGYSLPKSRMKDGSYDGIFGEETKKALEKYQKDYQQGQSLPIINDKLDVWQKEDGDYINIVPTHLRDKNEQASAALYIQAKNSKNELPKGKTIDKTREALHNVGVKSWNSMKDGGSIKWPVSNFSEGGMFKKLGADVKWPTLENYDDGGIYTFPGRPGSYYKQQSDGTYLIKNNKTNGQYIKMNDPDGTRTKTLNAGRVAYKKPVQTQITPGNTQVSESTSVNNIYQKPLSTINYNPNVNALTNQTIPLSNTKPQVVKPKSVVATNFNINTTDQVKKANAITKEKEIQETILANERLSKNALPEREKTQAEFEADQWKKYDKLDWASKLLDRGKAFGVDPLGMATRVLTGDQGYIPGMGDGIFSEDENERKKFLTSMNYTPGKFEASDVQNMLNPFYWGASAGSKIGDGLFNSTDEYGNHKVDLIKTGTGVVEGGLAMFGANKAPQAVNQFTGKVAPKVQKVSDIITKAGKNYDLLRKTPLAEMVGQGWNEIAWNGSKKLGTSNFAAGRVFGNLPNNIASRSFRNISPYLNLSNAAKVYAGYKAGKGVMDGTTLHKNQQVYEDIKNGDFNAGNLYDAASADLKLASAFAAPFTHALDFKVIKGADKLAHYGAATTNPFNYDSYAKGFFKLNENLNKKNGGIITNNILIKYPQMYSANKKLDQFFNGGTI